MKKLILYITLAIILLACNNSDKKDNSTIANSIDSLMNYSHANGLFNGTVLVSQNNEMIYRNSFGYADFDKKELLIPESSFYLASVSKPFTTMAVILLKEKGKLSYDDKLSDYFPDFPDYAEKVTIRHMLTHTSGLPEHFGLGSYKVGLNNDDVYNILLQQEELDFEPGSKYSYTNSGYNLLSMIVEKVSEQPFHEFMKADIFTPLEMTSTLVYDKSEPLVANRVIGHNMAGMVNDYEIFTTGAGGIYSNIDDLFKWDKALNNHQLVSAEGLNEAYQPTILSSGDTSYYGFGWGINREKNWVGHSGTLSGFRTHIRRYLDKGDALIILTNKGDAVAMREITSALEAILSNEDFELPEIPLSNRLVQIIDSVGIDKAIETLKELQSQNNDEVEYDEAGINSLGYAFLKSDEREIALKLFKLNVEIRPNSSNAYDSYAEALLVNEDTSAAIENYTISVKKNPNSQNGINILDALGIDTKEILPNIKLTEEQLQDFVGSYEIETDYILKITREGDHLYIHPTGQSEMELFAVTESKFYSKIVNAQVTFNKDEVGNIRSLTIHQGGNYDAVKIE